MAQGLYISQCASVETAGFFNGYFMMIFQSSQVIGSAIASGIFESEYGQLIVFIVFGVMSIAGALMFLMLKTPIKVGEDQKPEEISKGFKEDVKTVWALMIDKRMLILMPFIIWSAASQAVFSALLVPLNVRTMQSSYLLEYPELKGNDNK